MLDSPDKDKQAEARDRRAEDRGIGSRQKTSSDSQISAFEFACKVVELIPALEKLGTVGRVIGDRIIVAGTSVGANLEGAYASGVTRDEMLKSYQAAIADARQAVYWMRLVVRTGLLTANEIGGLLAESEALLTSVIAAEKQARHSPQRFFQ